MAQGQTDYEYRYWFDKDDANVQTGTFTPGTLHLDVDLSTLDASLHTIHIQVKNGEGEWSSPVTKYFVRKATSLTPLVYWLDSQATPLEMSSQSGHFDLDVSAMDDGIHMLRLQLSEATEDSSSPVSRFFFKMPMAKQTTLLSWFDADKGNVKKLEYNGGKPFLLDVSEIADGFHVLYLQAMGKGGFSMPSTKMFIKIPQTEGVSYLTCVCSIDGKLFKTEQVSSEGGIVNWNLDVAPLSQGIHNMQVQVLTPTGAATNVSNHFFFRAITKEELNNMKLVYSLDGKEFHAATGDAANGLFHFDIDVASLEDGLHRIIYNLASDNGTSTKVNTSFFWKTPIGGNGIMEYRYWLNDNEADARVKVLDNRLSPFSLVTLLPVESQPIRSSYFQFEVKDGVPMMYAKNDFHIAFYDASFRRVDETNQFVDYNVSQKVEDIADLQSTQTFTRPDENDIKWFKFEAAPGDTIGFKSSQATSLQVFAPSGKEILTTMGDKSVQYTGAHTWEDGTYYVAVHDVTGTKSNVTLDYMHMDKYDVVNQDVHVVGNGGCSTISFTGNGFKNLYAIDIVGNGNCIRHINIGHESNTRTSASFDFANAKVGIYDIVFHFVDEDKIIKGILEIEKAVPLSITSEVAFSPSYLRGKSTIYNITVTNTGNMTAYMLPIYTFIEGNGVERVYFHNMELPNTLNNICTESLSKDEIAYIDSYLHSKGDLWHFLHGKANVNTSEQKETYSNYFFATIPPKTSVTYKLEIYSSEPVAAYITAPDEWHSVLFDTDTSKRNSSKAIMKSDKSYCCIRDNIECFINGVAVTLDIASLGTYLLTIGFPESGITEAAAAIASAGSCAASSLNASLGPINTVICNAIGNEADVLAGIKNSIKAASISGAILSCLSHCTSLFKDVIKLSKAEDITQGGIFNTLISFFDIAGGGYSCSSYTTAKPGCPPIPPGGGTSTPVAPVDPNDILGYVAQSGSHYVGVNQKKLGYTIEFENDATKATASAHEIVIKDKLDANIFDCNSIHTSKVVVGKHEVDVDIDGEFVKTIDMRPAINALAEVKLKISSNGEVVYSITSLDPMTAESTTDMMAGILPINNANKDGEGYIVFDVKLKDGLADGTKIDNAASIIFDANDAISTPVWANETDYVMPVGYVDCIKQLDSNHIKIEMDGIDERSGIWKYDLYYQAGIGSSWFPLIENLTSNSYEMEVYDDIDYGFCVVATDMAGNKEVKSLSRDYSYLNGVITSGIEKVEMNNSNIKGRVYDLSGRRVKGKPSKGIYIVKGKKVLFQ